MVKNGIKINKSYSANGVGIRNFLFNKKVSLSKLVDQVSVLLLTISRSHNIGAQIKGSPGVSISEHMAFFFLFFFLRKRAYGLFVMHM